MPNKERICPNCHNGEVLEGGDLVTCFTCKGDFDMDSPENKAKRLDAVIAHIYWRLSSDNTGENYKDDNSYYSTHEMHCIRRELRRILTIAKGETK